MSFSVSVIIPVFNCEDYIEKAITSALMQPEVKEVVVINDGSTDNTEKIIETRVSKDKRIKLYHHPKKQNKGRSASRNLGIKKALYNYLAFLDADDFYLNDRFKNDKLLLESSQDIDGVYNAISAHFYRESSVEEKASLAITTVREKIPAGNLFEALFTGKYGYFSIDGLTLKRNVFDTIGLFNENLIVSEDTELFFRMSLKHKLVSGILNRPVAMRGVHETNVFNDASQYNKARIIMYESLFYWCGKNKIDKVIQDKLLNRLWIIRFRNNKNLINYLNYWIKLFSKNNNALFSVLSIKYFPIIRLRKKLFSFLYKSN